MIAIDHTTDIRCDPDRVFAFVADHLNAPQWQEGLDVVERVKGPVGVGAEHVFVRTFAGRRIESRNRFVAYDIAARFVEFEIPTGPITGRASYRVSAIPDGTSRVTSTMRLRVNGLWRLASPLLSRAMSRDSAKDALRLKRLLERIDETTNLTSAPESAVRQTTRRAASSGGRGACRACGVTFGSAAWLITARRAGTEPECPA